MALLRGHGVGVVADVRTVPRSRRHPQFDTDALARSLPENDVRYTHLPRLGGFRKPDPDSRNGGWENASFRGYADYALGEEFAAGLAELRELAAAAPTAMMCAEAQWWRCHRRLVSDRLLVAGDQVLHIESESSAPPHELTPFALVEDGRITYPPGGGQLSL